MTTSLMLMTACSSSGGENRPLDVEPVDRNPVERVDTTAATSGTIVDSGDGERSENVAEPSTPPRDVEFQDYGDNPFTRAADDSLSTFAIDVDTGSYTIMRSWVESGVTPPPDSVRTEEFVNFFDPGYAAPETDTFAVYADGAPTPWTDQPDDVVVRIGIKGRDLSARARPDMALTLVVDVSGSMREDNRLELVKDAIALLVDELDRGDTIGIVAYDDLAWTALPPTDGGDWESILAAVESLQPGGSTNAEAGILLGYDIASETFDSGAVNRVVLLSDGVANVGAEGPEGILEQIDRQVDDGIALLTIGVGLGNYNDVLMEQLADGADGNYRYVDDIEEAERVLVDELTGTLVTIAQDVKVQVDFNSEHVEWYRLIGFENRDVPDEEFRNDRVDGGEIGAGHAVTALYQVELWPDVHLDDRLATVSVVWVDPETGRADEVAGDVTAETVSERWADASAGFRLAATAAAYAEQLAGGHYADGYDLWDVADEAERLAEEIDDPAVGELAELVETVAGWDR